MNYSGIYDFDITEFYKLPEIKICNIKKSDLSYSLS